MKNLINAQNTLFLQKIHTAFVITFEMLKQICFVMWDAFYM